MHQRLESFFNKECVPRKYSKKSGPTLRSSAKQLKYIYEMIKNKLMLNKRQYLLQL